MFPHGLSLSLGRSPSHSLSLSHSSARSALALRCDGELRLARPFIINLAERETIARRWSRFHDNAAPAGERAHGLPTAPPTRSLRSSSSSSSASWQVSAENSSQAVSLPCSGGDSFIGQILISVYEILNVCF